MAVAAIIVIYYPVMERLRQVIKSVEEQVDFIFIIDNTPESVKKDHDFLISDKIHFKALNRNAGIATAQNTGIRQAEEYYADYLLFLDQDSVPDKGMIRVLINAWKILEEKGYTIAALGPSVKNRKNEKIYKARIDTGRKISPHIEKVRQLISSGSLMKKDVFREVGLFEESLFIDGVDFEWCWRAAEKGYNCFRVENTFIGHQFGEGENLFLGWAVPVPSPGRCYYLYRNYLRLLRRPYVPLYWKISYLFKLPARIFYYIIFVKPRKEYARNIWNGIYDGLKKSYGKAG